MRNLERLPHFQRFQLIATIHANLIQFFELMNGFRVSLPSQRQQMPTLVHLLFFRMGRHSPLHVNPTWSSFVLRNVAFSSDCTTEGSRREERSPGRLLFVVKHRRVTRKILQLLQRDNDDFFRRINFQDLHVIADGMPNGVTHREFLIIRKHHFYPILHTHAPS